MAFKSYNTIITRDTVVPNIFFINKKGKNLNYIYKNWSKQQTINFLCPCYTNTIFTNTFTPKMYMGFKSTTLNIFSTKTTCVKKLHLLITGEDRELLLFYYLPCVN